MSDAEYRLLIQRSFDEELSKQEHRAFVNHLETSDSGQKFHHQLDQMIQAAQDTPLPDDLRPQNPEALARTIMEQLPQKKGSIFAMFANLFGGGQPKAKAKDAGRSKVDKSDKKGNLNRGGRGAAKKASSQPAEDDEFEAPSERRKPGVKFGRKDREAEISAEDREDQMGTFSRLKSISTRADAAENRDNQSTTRSLGEKFGMPGGATSNPLDEAPLTLAESIKRKVSESQKLSPLEMDPDEYSSQEMPATGGDFGRPSQGQEAVEADSSWSSPTPIGLPIKQKMGAPVTAQGLDWSGAPAGTPATSFEQHPGSAIGLAPPGQKPNQNSAPLAQSASPTGGGLDWSSGTSSTSSANSAQSQSGWGSSAPAMEPTTPAFASPASNNSGGETQTPAKADSGWGSGWGSENQAPGAAGQNGGVPLKSSDSWAIPGSEAADAWGQPGSLVPAGQANSAPAISAPVAASQNSQDPWGSASVAGSGSVATPAEADGGNWGQAASWGAPNLVPNNTSNSLPSASAPPANDPWAQPAQSMAPPAQAPTAPVLNDPWAAATSTPAPVAQAQVAPATEAPWGSAAPQMVQANAIPAANPAPVANDPWAQAAAAPQAISAIEPAWGSPVQTETKPDQPPAAMGWGQSAAPAPSTEAAAWGAPAPTQGAVPASAAANQSWSPEGEQMETGVWKSFTPKTGPLAPANPTPAAAAAGDRWDSPIQDRPSPATVPVAQSPSATNATDASGGDRWDVPIQARTAGPELPAPVAVAAVGTSGLPVNQIVEKMGSVLGGNAAADSRWDVPIQARSASAEAPAPAPAPAPATMSAVGSSGIPVNQIVEKMGAVLGGTTAGAGTDSRWDLPIQERNKETNAESNQPLPVQNFAQPVAPTAWGETPSASPTNNTWGTHPEQPTTTPWGAVTPQAAQSSDASASPAPSWGGDQLPFGTSAPAAEPAAWSAAVPNSNQISNPVSAQNVPSPTAWGTEAPAVAANNWDSSTGAAASPASAATEQWGQPPAWGQAQVPQAPAPAEAAELTDKPAHNGMFNLGDQDIDKIFGDNLGVSEPVGRPLVKNVAESQAQASVPALAAPQPAQTNNFAPPLAAPNMAAPSAAADANAAKNGLFQLTDNDLDKLFSSNLGVDEPSTQVGVQATISPVQAAAPNNFAPPAAAASPGWNTGAEQQAAPAGWGVSAPAPTPVAAAGSNGASGWSSPQSPSGWGMEQQQGGGPSGWSSSGAPAAAEATQPTGWGSPTAPTPPAWNQPAAAPVANLASSPETAKGGLFSVDDNAMNRIFSDNLGIPEDTSPKADAYAIPDQGGEQVAPPKIAGIGRLDASGDQNQDAGSGRIASIGKFLLDQKDLDKIGKLTSSDLNEGKMRILTLEASQDLQSLLSQIGTQQGVIGSVIVGHDGLLIANTMPGDMDAESVGVWALGVYMNTEHVTKKMGHDRVHQVVSRTPRGYVVIADFGGGLLVTVTDGRDTDSLIPLMRTITQLVN
ncbi:roadblock/LC7 domain-containing protein [bacterium]|nr:roadblock/LC7 domain-containing protein [bacterium]MBP9808403.1 roadblock/LC7 domain-containing protein [bacterium]